MPWRDGRIIERRRDAGAQFDAGLVDALQAALLEAPAPNGASARSGPVKEVA